MTDQESKTYRLLELFWPAALVFLTATGGIVVWSSHNFEWPGFVAYLLVGFFIGGIAGGLVGVPLISSWAVMGVAAAPGWRRGFAGLAFPQRISKLCHASRSL